MSYGIALMSRLEATTWQVVRLPRIPVKFPMYLPGPRKVLTVDEEPCAAVLARFDTDLGPLTVASTHLSFVPGWNRVQLRRHVFGADAVDLGSPPAGHRRVAPLTPRRAHRRS
jgi:hypothetical protein